MQGGFSGCGDLHGVMGNLGDSLETLGEAFAASV